MYYVLWDGQYQCVYGEDEMNVFVSNLVEQGIDDHDIIVFHEDDQL